MADCSAKNEMVVGEPLCARYIHMISIMSSSKTKLSIFDIMLYTFENFFTNIWEGPTRLVFHLFGDYICAIIAIL